jgi:hypothetical protein
MTRNDILRIAREACEVAPREDWNSTAWVLSDEGLERFAALVAAAEREACAQLALQGTGEAVQTRTLEILQSERQRIADAIRARSEK